MFKRFFKWTAENVTTLFYSMPVTLGIVLTATLLAEIFIADVGIRFEVVGDILVFLGLAACGTFFSEKTFRRSLPARIASIVVTSALSLFLTAVSQEYLFDLSSAYLSAYFLPIMIAYVSVTLILGIRACLRESGKSLSDYAAGSGMNLLRTTVLVHVMLLGLMLLVLIIYLLFVQASLWFYRTAIFVYGAVYVPGCLIALTHVEEEKGRFARVLVSYIAFPIVAAAYVIIYAYMVKIVITQTIPSNSVFAILTGVFCAGIPVLLMTESINPHPFFKTTIRILYFLYFPFVLMQCWCLGVRIAAYGITPKRYFGIVIIITELIYLLLAVIRPSKRTLMFPILAVLSVITLAIPGISANAVSRASQNARLMSFERASTVESAKKAWGAFQYLEDEPDEIKNALSRRSEEEQKALRDRIVEVMNEEGEELDVTDRDYFTITPFDEGCEALDVTGYSRVRYAEADHYSYSWDETVEDWQTLDFSYGSDGDVLTVDLSEWLDELFAYSEAQDGELYRDYPEEKRYITVNDEITLYVMYCYVYIEKEENVIADVGLSFKAMILYR